MNDLFYEFHAECCFDCVREVLTDNYFGTIVCFYAFGKGERVDGATIGCFESVMFERTNCIQSEPRQAVNSLM